MDEDFVGIAFAHHVRDLIFTRARRKLRPKIFDFGQFRLDTGAVELRGPEGVVRLEPKGFLLLKILIEEHARAVPKPELFEAIWPGVFVTDASLSTAVKQLRSAVGDDGERQAVIKTVRGVGFRFVADGVERSSASAATPPPEHKSTGPASHRKGKPTVAIRPFQLIGSDPAHQAIAEAIPAEIIATLSKLQWINVIARGSSFRFGVTDQDSVEMTMRFGRAVSCVRSCRVDGPTHRFVH